MKGKTKVKVIEEFIPPNKLEKGMEGYIDGYLSVRKIPHAVIVSGKMIDVVPIYALEIITEPNPMTEDEVETYLNNIYMGY